MSNTPNAGQADRVPLRRRPLVLLLGAVVAVIAVVIGIQGIGILYSIVFPAMPPLPPGAREVRHETTSYGADSWVFASDQTACEVINFYREQAKGCLLTPSTCETGSTAPPTGRSQHVGRCQGEISFSLFTMSWKVNVGTGNNATDTTSFALQREIYWTGAENRPTPEFPDS